MQEILQSAYEYAQEFTKYGELVTYIPELAKANKFNLAAAIIDKDAKIYEVGDVEIKFSIMSIVKVILYLMALENYKYGEILEHVGVKPSSKDYNSLLDLEMSEKKIPVNPFINAGAIATTYMLYKRFENNTVDEILKKARILMNNETIQYSQDIVDTALDFADTNYSIAYALKKNKIIQPKTDITLILEIYCKACAIMVNTRDLATFGSVLSRNGKDLTGKQIIKEAHARILRTLMAMCGTYNYAGEFAIDVGVPAKTGVGGGLVATTNKNIGIAAYSPGLDEKANPIAPMKLVKFLSKRLELSIY